MKTKINFRRVLIIAGLTTLAIVYVVFWLRMITSSEERTGSDFIAFYAAGRVARGYGAAHVYDADLQQAIQQVQVGFELVSGQVLLYNHMPFLIPLLSVLVNGNYVASFIRWVVILIIVYAIATTALIWLLRRDFDGRTVLLICAGTLTFFPLFVSLMNGQDTAFLFLGACLWLVGLLLERDPLAGLGLALTTIRPHLTILLALPFLFRRRKVLLWFGLGVSVLAAVSLFVLGVDGTRCFINLLFVSAGGMWYGMKEPEMFNLIGLLWRVAPGLGAGTIHLAGWGVYLTAALTLSIVWMRSKALIGKHAGLALTLGLFAVPHLHYHDLTLLLLPLMGLLLVIVREGRLCQVDVALLPLGLSLLLLLSNFTPVLKYSIPYLVMLFLALALWFPDRIFPRKVQLQGDKP